MFGSNTRLDDFLLKCKSICFMELSDSGFSSLAASSYALHVAEMGHSVCYTECDIPRNRPKLLYDSVAMDKRFERKGFIDFYAIAKEDRRLHSFSNEEYGVNWRLITPENVTEGTELTQLQMSRLVFSARGDLCIYDYGACKLYDTLLSDMDAIICFVDPLPSKLVNNIDRLEFVQRKFIDCSSYLWVVYNVNSGVSRRQVKGLLRNREVYWMDEIKRSDIYGAEFRCRFPWETSDVRNAFEELFISK